MTPVDIDKLKPCPNPWCTATTAPLPFRAPGRGWRFICACGVQTFTKDTEDQARDLWNTRPQDAALIAKAERVDALEAALREIRDLNHGVAGMTVRQVDEAYSAFARNAFSPKESE